MGIYKKVFLQRGDASEVVSHEQSYRLGRLIEAYGNIFPENDLKKAKAILSERREAGRNSDLVLLNNMEDLGRLGEELDILVYGVMQADADGAEFISQLHSIPERLTPLVAIASDDNPQYESVLEASDIVVKINAVVDSITEDAIQFDPNSIDAVEQNLLDNNLLPADSDIRRLVLLSLFRSQHFDLIIRYLSGEFNTEKFIDHYRDLLAKYPQVYHPECLDCVSSALGRSSGVSMP